MAKNNRNSVFNIAFILVLVFILVVPFNSTVIARPTTNMESEFLNTMVPSLDSETLAKEPLSPLQKVVQAPPDTGIKLSGVNILQEQPTVLSGWFSVIWGESKNPSNGIPVTRYLLTDDSGKSTNLILGEVVSGLAGGVISLDNKYVTVEGTWLDQSSTGQNSVLNVTSISLASSKGLSESRETAGVSGTIPFISILCKFNDVAVEPKDLGYFQGLYSTSGPQLGDYWDQVSYGQISMIGSNAVGWFTLPQSKSYYVYDMNSDGYVDLDFDRTANDCIATADPTVDFSAYSNGGINLMFNDELDSFAWNGCRPMSLDGIDQCWPMTWEPPWAYSNISVMAYQLGHLLGMPNSSGHGIEYNNVWDLMGDNWASCENTTNSFYGCLAQHPNAFNKSVMGWIHSDQIYNLPYNTEATINLEQLALPSSNNYLLAEIPILGSSTHYYTVEVRNQTGFDEKLPGKAVIIHEVNTERTIPADVIDLDSTDYTGDAGAMWLVGEKFIDSANKVTIDVLSATMTGFQVKVRSGTVPVGYGTYDDRSGDILYTGSWVAQPLTGNYLKTEKYSTLIGSTAQLDFSGEEVSIIYRGYPAILGNLGITIDGVDYGAINQNTTTQTLQNQWHSGNLGPGDHTIVLTHLTGTYVTLDGFIISGPPAATPTQTSTLSPTNTRTPTATFTPRPPVGYGTYDDRSAEVVYGGTWMAQAITGNFLKTEKYSTAIGSTAQFTFTGENITVIYRGYPTLFGNIGIAIDGVDVDTFNQTTSPQTFQKRWSSGDLGAGVHTIVLTHLSGTYVTLDGFIVSGPPAATPTQTSTLSPTNTRTPTETLTPLPPVGYGTYDERTPGIVYTGSWMAQALTGNYQNTEKYSKVIGSSAQFTFSGEEISIIYRKYPTVLGNMGIAIDGVDFGTIDQKASVQTLQNHWQSGDLGPGTHTIVMTHLTGMYVALDGIIVSGPANETPAVTSTSTPTMTSTPTVTSTPLGAVGYGTYDDRSAQIVFTGTWLTQVMTGNYLNTEKYSTLIGSTSQFTFTGENISVIYRSYPTVFGIMGVNIDGVDVATINQLTSAQKKQLRWSSGNLEAGVHTITLTHLTGTYVTLDGIIVSGPATATPIAGLTATPKPIYPYNLVHSGKFGSQTLANCHAVGYAKKVSGTTGKIYIRIYVDDVLVGGQYSIKGGTFDFDLTNLPGFTFTTGIEHEIRLMAILENTLPYDLINPVTHQPGGLLTCH